MSEKRTTRARAAKEEAAARPPPDPPAETPSKPAAKSSLKRKRESVVPTKDPAPNVDTPIEDVKYLPVALPTALIDRQPLPTLPEPQLPNLSPQEYQSIIESGVLNAALTRSRETWLSGCYFKTFYTKVVAARRLKERTEEEKQALAREKVLLRSMQKIGNASLVIEPHTFLIELWSNEHAVPVSKQKTVYNQWPANQQGNQYSPYQSYQQSPMTPQYSKPPPANPPQQKPIPPPSKTPAPTPPTSGQAPDPVIHMLAQRAGTDSKLKAVMKIVAAGQATPEQLEFFQNHINELTKILETRQAAEAKVAREAQAKAEQAKTATPTPKPAPIPPKPHSVPAQPYKSGQSPAPQAPVPVARPPSTPYSPYSTPTQPYHNSPYGPSPKPVFRSVYFSFEGENGDRFYFPPYSILEWLPGGRKVKASFLITKSKAVPKDTTLSTPANSTPGPNPDGTNTNTNTPTPVTGHSPSTPATLARPQDNGPEKEDVNSIETYQPITAIVSIEDHNTNPHLLEYLRYAVHPLDVVSKYMNEVFDHAKPSEEGYLALQLPREGAEEAVAQVVTDVDKGRRASATPATPATPVGDFALPERKRGAGRPRKVAV